MVVVDSFAKIKPVRPKNSDPYEFDMAWGGLLQSLAQERQVCILLIYHNRKSEGEDPLDDVIGSTGLTGAVDAVLILRRGRGQADGTLLVTGRDVEEQELALKFHPGEGLWELIGPAAECAISQERKEILLILSEAGPKTLAQLAKILNKKYDAVRMILARMKDAGLVRMKESGEYQIV
jgi:DNA-binding transcriptional ArsR family regulator